MIGQRILAALHPTCGSAEIKELVVRIGKIEPVTETDRREAKVAPDSEEFHGAQRKR